MDPLTDVGVSIASQSASSLLTKVRKHIRYLIKYKDNLKDLKVAKDRLDAKMTDAGRFLDDTNKKLKDVGSTTTLWRTKANELHKNAQDIFSGNKISCLNLWSRYTVSKNAWEVTQEIEKHVEKAPDFGTTFDRPEPELGSLFNLKGFMEFKSRLRVLDGVIEALMDEEVIMCSMCGMGGTGKTTLAKKLIQRVEMDHLFDKVAMVTVSQIPNLEAIQKDIIEQLGLKMDEGTTKARAKNLNAWLANSNTLLVLDDVWWQLSEEDFENVGIPLGNKRCKIVVTSRNEEECKKMGSQRNFPIGVLEHEEALELFRLNAGKCIEDLNLKDTAKNIADECDGLPIAIVTIATALKDNPTSVWNDSLRHLRNSNLQRISGMGKVFSRIQLSFDLLKDKEAQSCFLHCCLYPEDFDVSIEYLVFMGKGLELFENVESINEARDRVEAIIFKLKKSFLLLDGKKDGHVKMHDIMRDFAISISSCSYLVRHGKEITKWPETHLYESLSAISLLFEIIKDHPVDLKCPKLQLLFLCFLYGSAELPFTLFEGMTELKVLLLEVPLILPPLSTLKELRTLIIFEKSNQWGDRAPPKIGDLLGHGDLKNLEILVISTLRRTGNDFPVEIGLLCNLRFLQVSGVPFKYMPPGVLSKLVKLEELILPSKFTSWGCKEKVGERVNASLDEVESLPLTRLNILVKESSSFGEKFVDKLERFKILIGSYVYVDKVYYSELNAALCVSDVDESIVTMNWIISLLRKSEFLGLSNVKNLKNLMFLPRLLQLKNIDVQYCGEMDCLITTTMQAPCFNNLTHVTIYRCDRLKYVFPLSVATQARQLQSIEIRECSELEEILSKVDDDNANQIVEENVPKDDVATGSEVMFPRLKELKFVNNPKLRVFYGGNEAIELPSIEEIIIWYCHYMEAFSYGSLSAPKLKQVILDGTNYYKDGVEDLNALFKEWADGVELRVIYGGNEAIKLPSFEEYQLIVVYCWLVNFFEDDVEDG